MTGHVLPTKSLEYNCQEMCHFLALEKLQALGADVLSAVHHRLIVHQGGGHDTMAHIDDAALVEYSKISQ